MKVLGPREYSNAENYLVLSRNNSFWRWSLLHGRNEIFSWLHSYSPGHAQHFARLISLIHFQI